MVQDGALIAIRWARRIKNHEPDWSKWHLAKAGEAFTVCGQIVVLFEVDGSPQEGQINSVNCKHCSKAIKA